MGEACSTYEAGGKGVYSVLMRIPEGKRPLGRPNIPFITQECTM